MELTVGPLQFFWPAERWRAFHLGLAEAPVARVVLGELVCSKRAPFIVPHLPEAIEALTAAGKAVTVASLALITLKRERRMAAALAEAGAVVEVNDLTMLAYLPEGAAFAVGPLVNVYNEGTLRTLAARGMTRICLPPEVPLSAIGPIAAAAADLGVAVEVWGWGRAPLAISGRCYHARLAGRAKDDCRFVCEEDPDGREVADLDGRDFLAINGVQTVSHGYVTAAAHLEDLRAAGVAALRLSPHSGGFHGVIRAFRRALDEGLDRASAQQAIATASAGRPLVGGFLEGAPGATALAE